MSFGFSISDFLTVIQLANKIRKDFAGAPNEFKGASDVVRSLSIVLLDAEVAVSGRELSPKEEADLKSILDGCQNILSELECILNKYTELGSQQSSIGRKVIRAWKRLSLEPEDIRNLRSRVNDNINLLNAFTLRRTSDDTAKLVRYQEDQEQQAIFDWLTPVDYASQQNDFLKQRQDGTGQWLLDSAEFKSWVKTKKQTLFCQGIPGAGKTILTSIVVEELSTRFQGDSSIIVTYVYCNFKRQNEQTLEDLLASILKQLAQGRSSLPQSVRSLYDQCKSKGRPLKYDILRALHTVAAEYSRVFILVDALDECRVNDNCREDLLSEISELQNRCGVNIFATSRFIPDITQRFERDLRLDIRANEQDVQRYVKGHIHDLPRFVRRDPGLQQEISSKIVKAIDGMFLLAQLHLNSLKGKRSLAAIRDALEKLSGGSEAYDRAYSDAMKRIEGQLPDEKELAKEVLSWITCAKRPLTTTELQHALAVKVGKEGFDETNIPDVEDIVSVCAGLVTVDESGIIRLVHYTTQEYFERTQKHWFPTAEFDITTICMTYLSFTIFENGFCHSDSSFEERLQLNPLYNYAACYGGHHARQASDLHEIIMDFLESESKVEAATQGMLARKYSRWHSNYSQDVPRRMTGLHFATYFGLTESIKVILRSADVESKDSWGRTPLSWAAWNGHEAVVKQLLEAKADVESKDSNGQTPLLWAAKNGHKAVVKQLLEAKADVELKDSWGRTPLLWAAKNEHEAVVKQLLEAKADVESKDSWGQTPLLLAAEKGYEAVIKQLLEAKADVEWKDSNGYTPLLWAAKNGHEAVVKQLLEAKADVESKDSWGQTPLLLAAEKGYEAVIKQLLKAKADVESKDIWGRTPLSLAVKYGHEAVVKLLQPTTMTTTSSHS